MIEKQIKDLLFNYDCVVVPGFGAFLTQMVSADIHPLTNKFVPPFKRIGFNEQLQINDGLLASYIAMKEGISREEANQMLEEFVLALKSELKQYNTFTIHELGRFFKNNENQLEFEPQQDFNYLEDSFGLNEFYCKPIDRDYNMTKVPPRTRPAVRSKDAENKEEILLDENGNPIPKQKKTGLKVFLILLPLVILAGAGYLIFSKQDRSLSSLNPLDLFGQGAKESSGELVLSDTTTNPFSESETASAEPESLVEPSPADDFAATETPAVTENTTPVTTEKAVRKPKAAVESSVPTISEKQGRYFIIAGSFSKQENANKLRKKLKKEGGDVKVIAPANENYKVAVADFDSKEQALARLDELKGQYGSSLWIMAY